MLAPFLSTSHTPFIDNLDKGLNANDGVVKANEPKTLDYLTVSLLTSELLEVQKYDQFCQLVLANKDSDANSGF